MNRLLLFLATNLAVVAVLSLILQLLGVAGRGTPLLPWLLVTSLIGMGGAFISLLMSRSLALRATGAQPLTSPRTAEEAWLLTTVQRLAARAGLPMPEVAIFAADAPNAFATGASRDAALVAVSTGLLAHMDQDEVEAVLGHELTHVANGDMVTLTLLQGVVNTFVMVFATLIASALDRDRNGRRGVGYYLGYLLAQSVLGVLATLIVCWFSRQREFRADAGGAALAGRQKMIAALERLQAAESPALPAELTAFGISAGMPGGLAALFATHPPLEARLAALRREG